MQHPARQLRKWRVIHYASRHRATCLGMTAMGLVVCTLVLLSQRAAHEDAFVQPTMCPTPSMRCPALTQPSLASLPPHTEGQPEEQQLQQEEQMTRPPRLFPHVALPPIAAPDARRAPLLRRPGSPRARHDNSPTDTEAGDINVLITVVASHFVVRRETCYAVASAYFTGLPIVVVGYGEEEKHNNTRKLEYSMRAADRIGLRDSDVVMVLDNDLIFTGQDMLPYIDKFIAQSAASPRELDARAVREGRAMAPSVYSTETNCYTPQITHHSDPLCMVLYAERERMLVRYAQQHNANRSSSPFVMKPFYTPPGDLPRHINSGASIHRVWAMRALWQAMTRFMHENKPNGLGNLWQSDQSVLTGVYLDLRRWEVEEDVFAREAKAAVWGKSRYGVRAGQIGMDVWNELSAVVPADYAEAYELTSELWHGAKDARVVHKIYDPTAVPALVHAIHRGERRLRFATRTLRYLEYSYPHSDLDRATHTQSSNNLSSQVKKSEENTITLELSPPLLATAPRFVDGVARRVYPLTAHYAGYPKEPRLSMLLSHMPWYLPMRNDSAAWRRNWGYLHRMPIDLWSATQRMRANYAEACADLFVNWTALKP